MPGAQVPRAAADAALPQGAGRGPRVSLFFCGGAGELPERTKQEQQTAGTLFFFGGGSGEWVGGVANKLKDQSKNKNRVHVFFPFSVVEFVLCFFVFFFWGGGLVGVG